MRIIVFSDTHGRKNLVDDIVQMNLDAEQFIFLGDFEKDISNFSEFYPNKKILSVAGNCDFSPLSQTIGTTFIGGKKIMYLHGHTHSVKYGLLKLELLARENRADIVLFGHTHCRYSSYHNGLYILNPGSASSPRDGKPPSYAYIDITKGGVFVNHVDLK